MSFHDHIRDFPFLDVEQFCLVSHSLHLDYVKATLGDQRRLFRVDVNHSFTAEGCSYDWISILKHLDIRTSTEASAIMDLTKSMGNLGWDGEGEDYDIDMDFNAEDQDHEALLPGDSLRLHSASSQVSGLEVLYEIHLHPTYQVPTLWFSLNNLPEGEGPFNIDTIFKYLVPEKDLKKLRDLGYISLAQHPITSVPAWFVHPCGTPQALEPYKDEAKVHNYLRLWLGLVGPSVGLTLPLGMIPREE